MSLLNDSSLLIVRTLSVKWSVVVRCCHHDPSGVLARPFYDCSVLVVWPLPALTFCFSAVPDRTFSVQALGLYVMVYSFGAFATHSMIVVYTCGAVGRWINHCLFLSLGCSVISGRHQISL